MDVSHQYIAPYLGTFLLSLSLPVCFYGFLSAPLSSWTKDRVWYRSAVLSGRLLFWLLTTCVILLVGSFLTNNYAISYVANYSSSTLPVFFKFTGLWAGLDGSILFWTWMVSLFNFILITTGQKQVGARPLLPGIQTVMHGILLFFLILLVYADNPFTLAVVTLAEGKGLNPLLQNVSMVIHPPCMYLGFTSASVPFAFALSALATRRLDSQWIRQCRVWTILCWLFLSLGNLLGSQWAYVELGWGGFWAWDPVENAAIMPWFTASAFLHSVIIQEKRGMLKVWNMILVVLTFALTIFGTFLTRSGIVTSVHSFSNSTIGPFFVWFLILSLVISFALLIWRLPYLKPDHEMKSWVSKEGAFVLNNVIFIACAFTVCWGTMFPSISEWWSGKRISVGPPFFNAVMAPLALAILFLVGVGPLIAWKKAGMETLKRNFLFPILFSVLVTLLVWFTGVHRWYAVCTAFFSAFVVAGLWLEFYRGLRMLSVQGEDHSFLSGLAALLLSNSRKYGGYLVHLGMVLIALGIGGAVYQVEKDFVLKPDEMQTFEEYQLTFKELVTSDDAHRVEFAAKIDLADRHGKILKQITPARRVYKAQGQPSTEVALFHGLLEDVYVTFGAYNEGTKEVSVRVSLNPLVSYLWLGGMVTLLGGLLVLIPKRKAL